MVFLVVIGFFILILCFGTVLFFTRPSRESRTMIMRLTAIRNPRRSLKEDGEDLGIEEADTTSISGHLSTIIQKYPLSLKLERLFLQSQSSTTLGRFFLNSLFAGAIVGAIPVVAADSFVLGWMAAGVGIWIPYLWLKRKRKRRLAAFARALPDAIDLLARALRAGHSIQQALEVIAEQSPAPLCEEFGEVHSHQKFGIPFRDALLNMGDRIASKDLNFVITAILVQKETGGDLIHILERTTEVIRDRGRVEGEIKTYTAQGRLTGWILSLLPVVMLGIISILTPSYPKILFHDPLGQKLLIGGGVMITIGAMVIRRIVAVEI